MIAYKRWWRGNARRNGWTQSGHYIPILALTFLCSLIHHPFPVVLVLVFAICWAPFHIDRLFFSFVEEWTESLATVFNLIHVVSGKILAGLVVSQISTSSCHLEQLALLRYTNYYGDIDPKEIYQITIVGPTLLKTLSMVITAEKWSKKWPLCFVSNDHMTELGFMN